MTLDAIALLNRPQVYKMIERPSSYSAIFSSLIPTCTYGWWLRLLHSCACFQQQNPLLICALYWLSGILARSHPLCSGTLLCTLCLFTSNNAKKQIILGVLWSLSLLTHSDRAPHPASTASGEFLIKYGKNTTYHGQAISLTYPCGKHYVNLPCTITTQSPLEVNKKYNLQGETLDHTSQLIFKSNNYHQEIHPKKIAALHQKIRAASHRAIINLFSSPRAQSFASSLILGMPLSPELKDIFKNKGLSHLFAISGWHFSLFAWIVFLCLRPFPARVKHSLTLLILTLLTLIFPFSPSVWRSWISYALICLSPFFPGQCSSLSRLGIGFILCSFFFSPFSPDFALSFLATLGILLFFPHIFRFFYTPWQQITPPYLLPIFRYLWGSLSLTISAQSFLILPMLYFFGSIPLEGLLYSPLFSLLTPPLFFLILLSLCLPFLSSFTELCISLLLSFPPLHHPNLLISLSFPPPSPFPFTLLLIFLFIFGVFLKKSSSFEAHI